MAAVIAAAICTVPEAGFFISPSAVATVNAAEPATHESGLQYAITDSKVIITGYSGESDVVEVPSTIEDCPVTEIGEGAFVFSKITEITIPSSVTLINTAAFSLSLALETVHFSEGLVRIADGAFLLCPALNNVVLPSTLEEMGTLPFGMCVCIDNLSVSSDNKNFCVSDGALFSKDMKKLIMYFPGLTRSEYTLPSTVEVIDMGAFSYSSNLTAINIPDSVTEIMDSAFAGCTELTSLNIPKSVVKLGSAIVEVCEKLTELTVDADNPEYCAENSIIFNKEKTEILVFSPGKPDTAYTIPDGITRVGEGAFYACKKLTSVDIPDGVKSVGEGAFAECNFLTTEENVVYAYTWAVGIEDSDEEYDNINIKNGTVGISDSAFSGCANFNMVVIPDGVKYIGNSAFFGCEQLGSVTIPASVTEFGEKAFENCYKYGLIFSCIAGSVSEKYAFDNGFRLRSLTDKGIYYDYSPIDGKAAFCGCDSGVSELDFTGITFCGAPVSGISFDAYRNRIHIKSVVFSDDIVSIQSSAFMDCSGLSSVTFSDNISYIGIGAFISCSSLTSVTLPKGLKDLDVAAFEKCTALETVVIPEGLTTIGTEAFCDTAITDVTIPESVTTIDDYAFGYKLDETEGKFVPVKNFIIRGRAGSTAEKYANDNGFTFIELEEEIKPFSLGDPNGDCEITALDANLTLSYLAETDEEYTEEQLAAFDANSDGVVTPYDALLMLMFEAEIISEFPVAK